MTTITIERKLLEQALSALLLPCDRWNGAQYRIVKDAAEALLNALAAPATAPAWHDAPTVPGVWFCDEGDICYTWTAHNIEILDQFDPGSGLRWYGPIPQEPAP